MGKKRNAYERIWVQGKQTDRRSQSALKWAEKNYIAKAPKKRKPWSITQGGYNGGAGSVTASAGTHDGGGSYDLSVNGLSDKQIRGMVKWLRRAGFAAWFRNWTGNRHVHAILLGHKTASPGAKQQMTAYLNHRDGLAGNAWDGTWRPNPVPRWSHRRGEPYVPK